MAETAADILLQTLIDWGAEGVFGIRGNVNVVIETLRKEQDKIRFIATRTLRPSQPAASTRAVSP